MIDLIRVSSGSIAHWRIERCSTFDFYLFRVLCVNFCNSVRTILDKLHKSNCISQ